MRCTTLELIVENTAVRFCRQELLNRYSLSIFKSSSMTLLVGRVILLHQQYRGRRLLGLIRMRTEEHTHIQIFKITGPYSRSGRPQTQSWTTHDNCRFRASEMRWLCVRKSCNCIASSQASSVFLIFFVFFLLSEERYLTVHRVLHILSERYFHNRTQSEFPN